MTRSKAPWWRRWYTLVGVGVVVLIIIGALAPSGSDESSAPKKSAPPTSAVPTTKARVTTTTTPPTTTTTIAPQVLLNEVKQEVERACSEAYASGTRPLPEYRDRWASVTNSIKMQEAAQQCVDIKTRDALASAAPVNVDAIIKNPDAVKGQTFVMVVNISQYDAATGACSFRGYWDNTPHEYNFEYAGDNALFTSGDGDTDCPILSGIDQNDTVRLWAKSLGSLTYDTQIGGSTTAPSFDVLKAEIIKKE